MVVTLWAMILGGGAAAAQGLTWAQPKVAVRLPVGATAYETTFEFVNEGSRPVVISDLVVDCGCTTAALAQRRYAPGERGEVGLKFDGRGLHGKSERTLIVKWSERGSDAIQSSALHLEVEVTPWMTAKPRVLFWKKGGEPEEKAMVLTVQPGRDAALRVGELPAGVTARVESTGKAGEYRFVARPDATDAAGEWHVPVILTAGEETLEEQRLYLLVR